MSKEMTQSKKTFASFKVPSTRYWTNEGWYKGLTPEIKLFRFARSGEQSRFGVHSPGVTIECEKGRGPPEFQVKKTFIESISTNEYHSVSK